jgi:predicted RNase H-like nuclease
VNVTDFGEIRIGPLFRAAIDALQEDLSARKRTKKYQRAKREMDRLEACVCALASVYWAAGKDLLKTP